jgi:[protein-PII] uridylyltransferase
VQLLWDLGLEIGHSIRTVDECLSESKADITVQTSLLEARLVTGNARCSRNCRPIRRGDGPAGFLPRQDPEMRQRHAKYEDTPSAWSRTARKAPAACATCR